MALNTYQLINESTRFVDGSPEKADLLDRAIAAADESASLNMQFRARSARMTAAIFGGEAELALALFAWCRRMVVDRPDVFNGSETLWDYKLILMQLPKFAGISQQQIDAVSQEMEERYQAHGASMRPVLHKRAEAAAHQGRIEQARTLWDEALRHPRDGKADCQACEASFQIELLLGENRFKDLVAAAQPILSGKTRCAEVPHCTLPDIMLAQSAMGLAEEVEKLRPESYRLVRRNPNFINEVALHIELHVARGDLIEAARIATRHMPWLRISTSDTKQLHYLHALHCLMKALSAAPARPSAWRNSLLEALEAQYGGSGTKDNALEDRQKALAKQIEEKGSTLSARLDQRNGNDYYTRKWRAGPFTAVMPATNPKTCTSPLR